MDSEKDHKSNLEENYFFDNFSRKARILWRRAYSKHVLIGLLIFLVFYRLFISPPNNFPHLAVVKIPGGTTLLGASAILEKESIVRSPLILRMLVRFFDGQTGVKAGSYLFDKRQNAIMVASRLVDGDRGEASIVVTIPEGTSLREIADILTEKIPNFDGREFVALAFEKEGYLFPDTYHLSFDDSPEEVLQVFLSNFDKKMASVSSSLIEFDKPLPDVINMASLVEEEGRTMETRRMIAGILWKRLKIGMPLQVDAAFLYINGKNTFELSTEDLQKDSPYNTYTRAGLPPTAISNPGLDAILATITPISSTYLYYLTDKDGVMRYAKTHDEHVLNKEKYLK